MTETWLQERFPELSDSDLLCTGSLELKTEQLVPHIEAILVKLGEVSSMERDLVQLLEALSNILKKRIQEVT